MIHCLSKGKSAFKPCNNLCLQSEKKFTFLTMNYLMIVKLNHFTNWINRFYILRCVQKRVLSEFSKKLLRAHFQHFFITG